MVNILSTMSCKVCWVKSSFLRKWTTIERNRIENTLESKSRSVMSDSLWPHGLYSARNSPGQSTGVGSRSLLQGIFPTQGSNPGLPHCRQTLYQLSHKGSPTILEWVAYPFFSRSSWPRNRTAVSCIAGGFFTNELRGKLLLLLLLSRFSRVRLCATP